MATYMNIIGCNSLNLNTGIPNCSFDFGEISQIMLIPKDKKFTQTEIQTMYATLVALSAHATETSRGYPIGKFTGIEDKTGEVTLTNTPYGGVNLGRKPKPHYVFQFQNGGMTYDIMLNSFSDKQDAYDCLIFDKTANAIVGTTPDLNTSFYVLKGFSIEQIYNPYFKITSESVTEHKLGICFADAEEFTSKLAVYKLPSTQKVNNIVGLRNLEMSILPTNNAIFAGDTSLKIRFTTDGGSVDLGPTYGPSIAALFNDFAVLGSNGTSYDPTNGSYVASTKSVNFTVPALPAIGTELTITSPTITVLSLLLPGFANGTLVATVLAS